MSSAFLETQALIQPDRKAMVEVIRDEHAEAAESGDQPVAGDDDEEGEDEKSGEKAAD